MPNSALSHIKLVLLDVDGVLTDGRIYFNDKGVESKAFNSKDGLGLRLLMEAGIQVGIVTGRKSKALQYRCENLNIDLVFENVHDKASVMSQIVARSGVDPEAMLFVGDDLLDLALFACVGVSVAVADAHPDVRQKADIITRAKGGAGAVREICDAILKDKGLWDDIVGRYAQPEQ